MKLKFFIITFATLSALSMAQNNNGAQDQQSNRDAQGNIVRGAYETNRFFDNMFIQAGVGAGIYLGGQNANFNARIRPTYDIAIGKWITPTLGLRLQFNYTAAVREYSKIYVSPFYTGGGLQKFNFMNLHGDVMFNLSAAIGGYKETRVYEAIPYAGAGWANARYCSATANDQISLNFGIINKFRITPTIDINLELRSAFVSGNMDGSTINNSVDIPVAATAGITVRFGKVKSFKRVVRPDYTPYEKNIYKLEKQKSELDAANKKLAQELAAEKNKVVEVPVPIKENTTTINVTPVALFFAIGKSVLSDKDLVNLDFYVKNAIDKDPNKVFTLTGYADKATGNATINQRLSQERVEHVYNILVNKYKISKDRLIKKADGDSNNPFNLPELNRVVIID